MESDADISELFSQEHSDRKDTMNFFEGGLE